jgi:hypothetical protein
VAVRRGRGLGHQPQPSSGQQQWRHQRPYEGDRMPGRRPPPGRSSARRSPSTPAPTLIQCSSRRPRAPGSAFQLAQAAGHRRDRSTRGLVWYWKTIGSGRCVVDTVADRAGGSDHPSAGTSTPPARSAGPPIKAASPTTAGEPSSTGGYPC